MAIDSGQVGMFIEPAGTNNDQKDLIEPDQAATPPTTPEDNPTVQDATTRKSHIDEGSVVSSKNPCHISANARSRIRADSERTSSPSPVPVSDNRDSEFSSSTDEAGVKGSYKLSVEESNKRKKSRSEEDKDFDKKIPPTQYLYDWAKTSKEEKALKPKSPGWFRARKLPVETRVLPELTHEGETMTRATVSISLPKGCEGYLQHFLLEARVEVTLHDPQAKEDLCRHVACENFPEGKKNVRLMVNLARQEDIDKSGSKKLEIQLKVEVNKTKRPDYSIKSVGEFVYVMHAT